MSQSWSVYDPNRGVESIVLARSDIEACNKHLRLLGLARSEYVASRGLKVSGIGYYNRSGTEYTLKNGITLEVFKV